MEAPHVLTRPGARPDAVVRYGDHVEQVLDVHLPVVDDGPAPAVFLVHGGFWRQEYDRLHTRSLAQALANAGWGVVTPEYRRTGGDGGWPETFDDVATALERIRLLTDVVPDRLHLDTVTLLGHSAGGHLAMWLALRRDRPAFPRIRRAVALAPVSDLIDGHRRGVGEGAVAALMGGAPEDMPEAYAEADPAALLPGDVDVRVLHGDEDQQVPVDMSRAHAGTGSVTYVELPGVDHHALIDPLSDAWPHVTAALTD
jgi:acetyl esterase/lipase